MNARFGPAGNSDSFSAKYKSTVNAPQYLKEIGLDHYEYQCGRGVRVSDNLSADLRSEAEKNGITLSVHAPYFISLSGIEKEKRDKSIEYILQTCDAADRLGAKRIVIHSGSCAKISRAEALELAKDTLSRARKAAVEQGFEHIIFCPETMGKVNQLGNLSEVLELCRLDESFLPCVDFGHLNARDFGWIKGIEEYRYILDSIENSIGIERAKIFHSHFSKIEYTVPGGEKRHLTFENNNGFGPDYEPLMELIARRGYSPVFICESAGTQTEDALTMKKCYQSYLKTRRN
ncbi:MAG: TIM barrel protein [Ruminococcus sp.]|nr:TIM barrel protein [Ruminococcus sp.]